MIRRIKFAFRTLIGPWLLLPGIALELANLVQRGMPWRGEGMWTVEWFAISLFIIGPLCAGVAAVDAARLSRPGNIHLVVAVPAPARPYLRAAAWCALPLVTVHMLAICAGLLIGYVAQPSISWWAMASAALVQCLAIVWYVALGSAIGRFAAPVVAGVLGGACGFVLDYVVSDAFTGEPQFRLLALGSATVSRIGLDYNLGYLAGQATTFAATIVLLLFLPLRSRAGYRVPTLTAGGLAVIAVAIVVGGPAVFPNDRLVMATPQAPTLCVGELPQVCVYPEHARFLNLVDTHVRTLTESAQSAGYAALVPVRVEESSRSYEASKPGTVGLWLLSDAYEKGQIPLEEIAYYLVEPSHCEGLRGERPPSEVYDARFFAVLGTWLHIASIDLEYGYPAPAEILTPVEVEKIMAEFARCDLDGRS